MAGGTVPVWMVCASGCDWKSQFAKVQVVKSQLKRVVGGGEVIPVPPKVITCGLPAALLVMVVAPVKTAALSGVNVTLIEQFAPAAREPPQLVVLAKFPVVTMLVSVRLAVPTLVRVTTIGALVVETT